MLRIRSLIGRTLQSLLRPFDLELGHISQALHAREEREAQLRNAIAEIEALRHQLRTGGAEIEALRHQLRTAGAEIEALRHHDAQALAQLRNVGTELESLRRHLAREDGQKRLRDRAKPYLNRESLILLPKILACLEQSDRFVIIDGGAREMEQDCRWRPFPPERLRFFGFEADATEADRLSNLPTPAGLERRFYPAALGGISGTAHFEHNKASGGSSLLTQNREVTDRWKFENPLAVSLARDMFFPTQSEEIVVTTLEDWAKETGISEVDFIKLNVQGAELDILKSGGAPLQTTLGILVEVAFIESYYNRPMFSDLDEFLRDADFTFFDLLAHHYIGRADAPVTAIQTALVEPALGKQVSPGEQLIEGHALYLRDPIGSNFGLSQARTLKLISLAEAFGQVEYAFELVAWLRDRTDIAGSDTVKRLNRILNDATMEYNGYRYEAAK
jgi:FkbM family methyltransferase